VLGKYYIQQPQQITLLANIIGSEIEASEGHSNLSWPLFVCHAEYGLEHLKTDSAPRGRW
jgi:hypothetical protein